MELEKEREIGLLVETEISSNIALSPDGQYLVYGSFVSTVDGESIPAIKIWNWQTREEIHTLEGHRWEAECVAISIDGQILVSGSSSDEAIKVWNLATGQEIHTLKGHLGSVTSVAISADGQILVSGGSDKTIKIWNLATGQELLTLEGHSGCVASVAISADGQTIVSGSWSIDGDKTIKVWGLP